MINKVYTHVFDAGHGGSDPGALGKNSREADINLAIVKKCEKKMLEQGQKVVLTRNTDKYLTLAQRADIANKSGSYTFTSIHCNANAGTPATGIETFSHPVSAEGLKLSKLVQEDLLKATNLRNRGSKTANFGVLRMTKMVAILVESGFINNPNDEALLMQDSFQDKIAEAIVRGIFKYLRLTYKEKEVPITVVTPISKPLTETMYRVVTGSFSNRANADQRIAELKKAGFESFIAIK